MKVFKFTPPYRQDKNSSSRRTSFPETKNFPGVYIIKEDNKIVYVGYSSYSVYKTLYRHFQEWNHQFQEVITYASRLNRHKYTVRPILCTDKQACALEKRLIKKYHPRDNSIQYEQYLSEQDSKATAYGKSVEQIYFDQAKHPIEVTDDVPF